MSNPCLSFCLLFSPAFGYYSFCPPPHPVSYPIRVSPPDFLLGLCLQYQQWEYKALSCWQLVQWRWARHPGCAQRPPTVITPPPGLSALVITPLVANMAGQQTARKWEPCASRCVQHVRKHPAQHLPCFAGGRERGCVCSSSRKNKNAWKMKKKKRTQRWREDKVSMGRDREKRYFLLRISDLYV